MNVITDKLHNKVNNSIYAKWTYYLVITLFGSLLITVGAKISVPMIPVPVTMQTFAVLFLAMVFGSRLAVAAVLTYLVEAAIGIPVLSGPVAGFATLLGSTGGYLIGFGFAAAFAGYMAEQGYCQSRVMAFIIAFVSGLFILMTGTLYLSLIIGVKQAMSVGFMPFFLDNLLKAIMLALIVPALHSREQAH